MPTGTMNNTSTKFASLFLHKQVATLLLPRPSAINLDSIRKILIYATIGIGDMIMFTPALQAIRKKYSNAHITLLVSRSGCEEVVSESQLIDEIIYLDPSHWGTLRLSRKIMKGNFDLLISSYLCRSIHLNNLTLLSGIPHRAGHCSSTDWQCENDYLFNIKVPLVSGIHESKRGWLLAEAVHCEPANIQPIFFISEESERFADQFFKDHKLADKWVIAVQVGTVERQLWKQWRLQKLAQVCDRLLENHGIKVILIGSANHKSAFEEMARQMRQTPIIVAGNTSLKQSAALIKRCQATLCNDSGLMHISSAVGTPVIAIFGPTDPKWTGPMGSGHTLIRKSITCSASETRRVRTPSPCGCII
jgi:lipopolysaccharide heptosyltransferase II